MAFTKNKSAAVSGTTVASETPVVATPVAAAPATAEPTKAASGTGAAISRLKKADPAPAAKTYATSTDDAKSERILRQGVYQHVLVSPALAGMQFETTDQFLALVKEVADKTIAMIKGA